jgi:hypothetical protein
MHKIGGVQHQIYQQIIFCGQLARINLDSWTLDKLLFTNLIFLASIINFWICRISCLFVFFFSKYIFVSFQAVIITDSVSARHFRHWRLILHFIYKIPYLVSSDALDTKGYVQYNYDAGTSWQRYEFTLVRVCNGTSWL